MRDTKWRYRVIFFVQSRDLQEFLHKETEAGQKEGFQYHDLKFAQSSANGTGMSAVLVMTKFELDLRFLDKL